MIGVEDLWDLTPTQLDDIYKVLYADLKTTEPSLLNNNPTVEEFSPLNTAIDIVKHIVKVKLEEIESAKATAAKSKEKQKILEIIASKKDEGLHNMSIEELEKLYDSID